MAYELTYSLINNDTEYSVTGYTGTPDDLVIPSEYSGLPVTTIGNTAFRSCSSLTSVVIPDSVTTIGREAFSSCSSLTSVVIGDNVTTIGYMVFWFCTSLTSIEIPNSVTEIGFQVFSGCSNLTKVTLLAKTPASLAENVFLNISAEAKFYCLSSAIEAYKAATNWNTYANNFVADDIRLYFTMNSRAQKKYFVAKNDLVAADNEEIKNIIWG